MAICGVKIDDADIALAIKKEFGRVIYAAKHLKCHPDTIYEHLKRSAELRAVLAECRVRYDEIRLDWSEQILDEFTQQQRRKKNGSIDPDFDANHAFKASIYLLNNKGKERGYAHPEAAANKLPEAQMASLHTYVEAQRQKLLDNQPKKDS